MVPDNCYEWDSWRSERLGDFLRVNRGDKWSGWDLYRAPDPSCKFWCLHTGGFGASSRASLTIPHSQEQMSVRSLQSSPLMHFCWLELRTWEATSGNRTPLSRWNNMMAMFLGWSPVRWLCVSKALCVTLLSQALCCPSGTPTPRVLSAFLPSEDLGSSPGSATYRPRQVTPSLHLSVCRKQLIQKPPRGIKGWVHGGCSMVPALWEGSASCSLTWALARLQGRRE